MSKDEIEKSHAVIKQIKINKNRVLLSFYEKPTFILSDNIIKNIKHLIENIELKPFALANVEQKFECLYWIPKLEEVNVVDNKKSIMISKKDIKENKIFKIKLGLMEYMVIDYDIAEKILQSKNFDIEFEEIILD